jgi:hypothetical protein
VERVVTMMRGGGPISGCRRRKGQSPGAPVCLYQSARSVHDISKRTRGSDMLTARAAVDSAQVPLSNRVGGGRAHRRAKKGESAAGGEHVCTN